MKIMNRDMEEVSMKVKNEKKKAFTVVFVKIEFLKWFIFES
jgi:hypothetical protein